MDGLFSVFEQLGKSPTPPANTAQQWTLVGGASPQATPDGAAPQAAPTTAAEDAPEACKIVPSTIEFSEVSAYGAATNIPLLTLLKVMIAGTTSHAEAAKHRDAFSPPSASTTAAPTAPQAQKAGDDTMAVDPAETAKAPEAKPGILEALATLT